MRAFWWTKTVLIKVAAKLVVGARSHFLLWSPDGLVHTCRKTCGWGGICVMFTDLFVCFFVSLSFLYFLSLPLFHIFLHTLLSFFRSFFRSFVLPFFLVSVPHVFCVISVLSFFIFSFLYVCILLLFSCISRLCVLVLEVFRNKLAMWTKGLHTYVHTHIHTCIHTFMQA